jgi:putative spermidine/putrescine transport system ATP-binding protein
MYKLKLTGVSKRYQNVIALNETDLAVKTGEFVTFLGPSGSGKTTLLNIVAGMVPPSTGHILIDDRDVTHVSARERDLGMVFQNYALVPHLTVFENVAFPLRIRKVPNVEIAKRVTEVLEIVRLVHLADRKPDALSGGQRQRVSIARAIVYNPSLILMDEPLGALDKKLREQLQEEISLLHRNLGITVIYVTHDQHEALSMSDRIVLMNNGRIEQTGTPQQLYRSPRSIFAADFLGEANLLPARAEPGGASCVIEGSHRIALPAGHAARDGERLKIMIRPEHIRISESAPTGAREVGIRARLGQATFLGSVMKLSLTFGGDQRIVVSVNTEHLPTLPIGHELWLTWNCDKMVPFKSDSGTAPD